MKPQITQPIVMIDDSDEDYEITSELMRELGVRNKLIRYADGRTARAFIHSENKDTIAALPAFIILDLNLPVVNGRELLAEIRSTEWLRAIPVVVMSTTNEPGTIALCYERGANSYIVKPADLTETERTLKTMCDYWLEIVDAPPPPSERRNTTPLKPHL